MNKKTLNDLFDLLAMVAGHIAAVEQKVKELTRAGLFDDLDDLRALIENLVEDKKEIEAAIEKEKQKNQGRA